MSHSDTIARGVKATFVSRAITVVASGLLILLLTRFLLGPDEYGLLFLALSIVGVAQLFADLGLARSAARYVAEFKESDSAQVPHILRASLRYRLILIGAVITVLVAGRNLVAGLLDEPALGLLLLVGAAFLAFRSIQTFVAVVFQGFNAVQYSALVNVVNSVCRFTFVVAFVVLGLGVTGALLGYLASAVVATALGLALMYVRFYRTFEPAPHPEKGLKRRIAEYSVPLMASRSANVVDKRIDIILVGFFLNPAAVAFYTVAKQISEFLMTPAGSVGFAVSPSYGEDKANERLDRAARIYETTLQYVLLLYGPAAVGLVLLADPAVVLVFGDDYAEAVPVVQIFGVFLLFQAVTSVTTQGIDFLGRARHRAVAKGITSVANVGLNVVLIPTIGVVGAAIASVLTFGVYTLVTVYIMHVELPLRYDRLARIGVGTTVISVVMGGCVVFLAPHVSGFLTLGGVVLLGVLVWGVLAIASGMLDVRKTISFLT